MTQRNGFSRLRTLLAWPYVLFVLSMALVARICEQARIPARFFVQDIFVLTHSPAYWGLLSNVGAFLWVSAVSIGGFGAALLQESQPRLAALLRSASWLSVLMLCDDFFTLHEEVLPALLGVPQALLIGVELLLWGVWFVWHRHSLRSDSYWPHLLLCGVGFGGSLLIDQVFHHTPRWGRMDHYFWEDGLKLLGIVAWVAFLAQTAFQALRQRIRG
ncbi:MAG: hypothetical protein ACO1RX_08465 [Candidatus Sericytochromatia bacterium]